MSLINNAELNQYIKNMQDNVQLPQLEASHAGYVRKWFEDNLSNIGRYSHRDFERFGNLKQTHSAEYQQKRQDGWQALTEEVPHIDHLTYGTGILYIQGPMEIPLYEDNPKECMKGDDFYHVSRTGTQYFEKPTEEYKQWLEIEDGGPMVGYVWEFKLDQDNEGDEDGNWNWKTMVQSVGGEDPEEADLIGVDPSVEKVLPPKFNDADLYNVERERDHFPWIIVNSAQNESIKTLLNETFKSKNGMYDEEIPELAIGSYEPRNDISFTNGVEAILDFVSPAELGGGGGSSGASGAGTFVATNSRAATSRTTTRSNGSGSGNSGGAPKSSKEYRDSFFFRYGIAVNHPETYPPNQLSPEERDAFYKANLADDQKLYDSPPEAVPLSEWKGA